MNKWILSLCLLSAPVAFAAGIIEAGTYKGSGTLVLSPGDTVELQVESVIEPYNPSAGYQLITDTYSNGLFSKSYRYEVNQTDGIVSVSRNGVSSGSGYCVENTCHIEYSFADSKVAGEETFFIEGNRIERIGSRATNGGDVHHAKTSLTKIH